jgi:S1-C subfamily serine protease
VKDHRARCSIRTSVRSIARITVVLAALAWTRDTHASPDPSSSSRKTSPRKPADNAKKLAPTGFGRVFETNRAAVVRVQGLTPAGDESAPKKEQRAVSARSAKPPAWMTGFFIGAEGEVVFGAERAPPRQLRVETNEGELLDADLLGFDLGMKIAIARITSPQKARARVRALRVAHAPGLIEHAWVMAIKHDARGRAEPFAGVVEREPEIEASKKTPERMLVAPVLVPASPGSPVLSAEGELIGVALDEGARRTRVAAIESLTPFLRTVVLGRGSDKR